jgi:hypothetical protein
MKGSLVDAMGQAIDNAEVNLHALHSINVRYLARFAATRLAMECPRACDREQ